MKLLTTTILISLALVLSACTNPFGDNSLVDFGSMAALDWNNKYYDFGNQQIGSTSVKSFLISNSGTIDAIDCGSVTLSDNVNFGIVSQTCTTPTLAAGSQCEVVVESHPQTAGEKTLVIDRQCRVNSNTVTLTNQVKVTAIVPTAQWTPMTHSFGLIQTNQNTFSKKFVLSNQGTSAINNCGLVSVSNPTDFSIQSDTCGVNILAQGGTCEVTVIGHPSSAGIKTTTLNRTCESSFTFSTTLDQITVEGFDSFLGLYPPSYDFGNVYQTSTASNYIYVQNETLDVPVSCSAATLTDNTHFTLFYDDCGTRALGTWDGCNIGVETSAAAPLGEHFTNIVKSCTFPDTSVKTVTIPVRFNTVPSVPDVVVFNSSHDYGNTYVGGVGTDNPFYFYNQGYLAASGCGLPTLDNTTDFSIVTDNCNGTNITYNNYCDVTVRALPSSTGIKTANLSMTCAVGGTITATLQQNGRPSAPDLVVSPTNYNIGTVNVGSNADFTFNFINQGPLAGTGCSVATLSNTTDFSIFFDGCSTTDIAPNDACSVVVRASPGSAGSKSTTLTRTCSVGGSVVANFDATGYLVTPNLEWQTLTNDYGDVLVGAVSSDQYFYLYNNGTGAASSCSAPVLSDTTNFSIVADGCATNNLNSSNYCYVAVRALPQGYATYTATLSRTCGVGGTASTTTNGIQVTGRPFVDWQQKYGFYQFNNIRLTSESAEHTYYFRNMNSIQLNNCTTPSLTNATDFNLVSTNCTSTMSPTAMCEVVVKSSPVTLGLKSSSLTRACDESGPISTNLTATGINDGLPIQIATSQNYGCVLQDNGNVKCWGAGISGGVHYEELPFPTTIAGISNAVQLTSNQNGFCAVINDGTVKCWSSPSTVASLAGITNVKTIGMGEGFKCVLKLDNTIQCWGYNLYGQLGDGTGIDSTSTPVTVSGIANAKSLSVGSYHSCAQLADDTVKCWGYNGYGQLGDGNTWGGLAPVTVPAVGTVIDIKVGSHYSCAVQTDKTVKCWGANSDGRLGLGHANNTATPTTVAGVVNADQVFLGYDWNSDGPAATCAKMADGSAKCWGQGRGNGFSSNQLSPQLFTGLTDVNTMSVGKFYYGCAILNTSRVQCWGMNYYGNLGFGSRFSMNTILPAPVVLPKAVKQFATAGGTSRCYVYTDDTVGCIGANNSAQLGNGTLVDSKVVQVTPTGITGAKSITSDGNSYCAILMDDSIQCWGNSYVTYGTTPMTISSLGTPVQISGGWGFYCATLNDGRVQCWGKNFYSELGDGTTNSTLTPVLVVGINNATFVSPGTNYACAIVGTGAIKCWGSGWQGALGNNSGSNSTVPVDVVGISNAIKMKSNNSHSCALLSDATVKCWGQGDRGQLGNGSAGTSASPVVVSGLSGVVDISVSYQISCAIMSDTTLKCWGDRSDGTFGANGSSVQTTPALRVNTFGTTQFANSYDLGWLRGTNTEMQMVDSSLPSGYIEEPIFNVNGL